MSCPFPCFFLPSWLSEILYTVRESPSMCVVHAETQCGWTAKHVPTLQTQKPGTPRGGTGLSSSRIGKYLETPEKSSCIFSHAFFLYLLGEFMFDYRCLDYGLWETTVVSHRDLELCRCQIISSYKNSSLEVFFPPPHNILKAFSLCQLCILILKDLDIWNIQYALFPRQGVQLIPYVLK